MNKKTLFAILKVKRKVKETDKYGYKAILNKVNELYRCPKCNFFLVWGGVNRETLKCPKCDFSKPVSGFVMNDGYEF